jgi:hypothetical protein
MGKEEFFIKELEYIKNDKIKEFTIKAINLLPNYFLIIPSSSSLKYHPQYAISEGGLVKHTRACVMFAVECFRLDWYSDFSDDEKDLILASLFLHDGFKSGIIQEKYTKNDHPLIASNFIKNNAELQDILPNGYVEIISENILTHMGQWRFSKDGQELMPPPSSKMQKLIHFVDYVCSRKMFEVNFDVEPSKS